jgi:ATP-dependent Clp protease adaptor protein ClpS
MDFVVDVLCEVFGKTTDEAVRVMLQVHEDGVGVAGRYPAQVAETKVCVVHDRARASGYPLRCSMEPD